MSFMPTKARSGFIGGLAVVAVLILQSVEHWTVIDAVLTGLRDLGAGGKFAYDILMSRLLPLVIAVAAVYLSFEGRKESKEQCEHIQAPSDKARTENSPKQELSQSGIHIPISITNSGQPSPVPSVPPVIGKPESPRLTPLKAREIWIHKVQASVYSEVARPHNMANWGIVLPFENTASKESGIQTPTASSVTARLVFKNKEGDEKRINQGAWLDHFRYLINFGSGQNSRVDNSRQIQLIRDFQQSVQCQS
jgi:hypothetical protein